MLSRIRESDVMETIKRDLFRLPLRRTKIDEGQYRLLSLIAQHYGVKAEDVINSLIKNYVDMHLPDYIETMRTQLFEKSREAKRKCRFPMDSGSSATPEINRILLMPFPGCLPPPSAAEPLGGAGGDGPSDPPNMPLFSNGYSIRSEDLAAQLQNSMSKFWAKKRRKVSSVERDPNTLTIEETIALVEKQRVAEETFQGELNLK